MFCPNPKCKKEIPDDHSFCGYCGRKLVRTYSRRTRANGTGTAYKRGKTWTAAYIKGWKKVIVDGKEKLVPDKLTQGGFATKKEALEYIPQLKNGKRKTAGASTSFAALYTVWKPFYTPRIGESTMNGHIAAYAYFKDIHHIPFVDLSIDDLQDCVDECPKGRRTRENMKSLCSRLYEYAGARKMDVKDLSKFIWCGKDDTKTRASFDDLQIEKIKQSIGKIPYAEYIYCMIHLGFRPNEMLRLTADAYDPEHNCLIGGFKTEAGTDRVVTISPKIKQILADLISNASPYIFPREDGELMTDEYFREKVFYPAMAELGIQAIPQPGEHPLYKPYSCRHTFANLLKRVPGSDTDKAGLIGHADASMTKYYQSPDFASMAAITDAI